jgi:hypothetical protein
MQKGGKRGKGGKIRPKALTPDNQMIDPTTIFPRPSIETIRENTLNFSHFSIKRRD